MRPYRPAAFAHLGVALVAVFFAPSTAAAASTHLWSKSFGTTGASTRGFAVAADAAGNAVLAGSFNGTVNFGGSGLVAQGTDVVLAKYTSTGVHLWSRRFGGTLADQAYAVTLDGAGNVFVTGYFQGTASFGGTALTSAGSNDIFVAKYDATGNHLWSRSIGTDELDIGYSIAVDNAGNSIMTGYVHGVVPSDVIVARYDTAGVISWFKIIGSGNGYDEGLSVATDTSGNILVTGSFSGMVDFGGGNIWTPGEDWDAFVVKYAPNGAHLWSRGFGDVDLDAGVAIETDAAGNAVVTGYFAGSVDFGGGALVSVGSEVDIFLAKYDLNGTHVWSQRLGGTSYESGYALALTGSSVFLAGYFDGVANFGGGNLTSAGNIDIFLAEYGANGAHVESRRFGGPSADSAQSIAVDAAGNQYMTGYFGGSVDFGGGALASSGTPDMFLAKYGPVATAANDQPAIDALSIAAVPNPFNPTTTLHYRIPAPGRVNITVYDIRGARVATLLDQNEAAGAHSVSWQGHDHAGNTAASGVYFARITHAGETRTHKLVLIK